MEIVTKLSRGSRTFVAIAISDKQEIDKLRGKMPMWQFIRKMLAVYMAHVAEQERAA